LRLCLLALLLTHPGRRLPLPLLVLLSRQPFSLLPRPFRLLCLLLQPGSDPALLGRELLPLTLRRALTLQLRLLARGVHLRE